MRYLLIGLWSLLAMVRLSAQPMAAPVQVTGLRLESQDNDRRIAIQCHLLTTGNYPRYGFLLLEASADSQRWESVAEQQYWLRPHTRHPLLLRANRQVQHRYFRLTSRDPERRLTHWPLPAPRWQCAVRSASLARQADTTYLEYELDRREALLLRIYDRIGQQIHTRALPGTTAGKHRFPLDSQQLRRGNYLLVITQVADDRNVAELRLEL